MRRRRRAKQNPPATWPVLGIGALAGFGAAAVGFSQVGGLVLLGSGTYGLVKGDVTQKIVGGVMDIMGLGMVAVRGR